MKNDGGAAFPVPGLQHDANFNGMTLRDYFAAKALQGLLSNKDLMDQIPCDTEVPWGKIAEVTYLCADAMLEARDK
jgi:hypothetical protein